MDEEAVVKRCERKRWMAQGVEGLGENPRRVFSEISSLWRLGWERRILMKEEGRSQRSFSFRSRLRREGAKSSSCES